MLGKYCLFSALVLSLAGSSLAQESSESSNDRDSIAGRSLHQYAAQLQSDDRVIRLRAIRSLGPLGEPAGEVLCGALDHEDAAMRYIAAESLGDIGSKALEDCEKRLQNLAKHDKSLSVRMAASYALCRAGLLKTHLPLLIERLGYPERAMACSAAELIGKIGPPAQQAIETLESTYQKNRRGVKGGDYHIGRAAKNALRKVRGDP